MTRSDIIAAAQTLVGLTYPDPAYLAAVAPAEVAADDLRRADEIGRESGCGLTWLALARLVWGLAAEPYHDGRAFELVYAAAGGPGASPWRPAGALRLATEETPPQLGDGIVWGPNGPHVAHVDACVESGPDNFAASSGPHMLMFRVIAGGQRITAKDVEDGAPAETLGNETVKRLTRVIRWNGHAWVDRDNGRPLLAVIDADAMSERAQ